MPLVLDELLESASKETQLSDFGDGNFRPGLEVLIKSYNTEANLHEVGAKSVRGALLNSLTNRLKIVASQADHDVTKIPIPKPVFVIGLFRVGSTLLHQLLDLHPGLHGPKLWELYFPVSYPPGDAEDTRQANLAQQYAEAYFERAPQMKSLHYLEKNRPDECQRFFTNMMLSRIYLLRHYLPSYREWLQEQDHEAGYEYHKRQIQHMLWRNGEKRPVLKCPTHFWNLPQLLSVYPDAKIVMLHRDMRKVLSSTSNLCRTIRQSFSSDVDSKRIGAEWQSDLRLGIDRMLAWRKETDTKVLDVQYKDLVAAPKETFFTICRFAEVENAEALGGTIDTWMADNQQHKFGNKPYELGEFGLSANEIASKFEDYHQHFSVPPEQQA